MKRRISEEELFLVITRDRLSEMFEEPVGGAIMMKLKILRTTSFSMFFLLSASLVHAQEPAPTETPSRLSLFVHDFTTWLGHVGGASAKRPTAPPVRHSG